MSKYTVEKVHEIILGYVLEQGESLWEELEGEFYGKEKDYLDFLLSRNYITANQKENWLKYRYDDCEYENIEAMTYTTPDDFPYDLAEEYELYDEETDKFNYEKAVELGLINVPMFIDVPDVSEFNEIYWNKVLLIIAEYLQDNLSLYSEKLEEMEKLANYYRGK